tara:strand:+ start:137 stop:514 length:378 start_codon:yes stop_codon:yes gene_type:complete
MVHSEDFFDEYMRDKKTLVEFFKKKNLPGDCPKMFAGLIDNIWCYGAAGIDTSGVMARNLTFITHMKLERMGITDEEAVKYMFQGDFPATVARIFTEIKSKGPSAYDAAHYVYKALEFCKNEGGA